ncbi:MAG: hypothetical protein AAB290_03330 [Candidatus Eisenbacteria bacterium]
MRSTAFIGVLAALAALTLSPADTYAQWSALGLSGRQVTQLRSNHGLLYACTSDGLHRQASDTADSAWVLLGFAGQRVLDLLAVSPETLIVAREITGTGADTVAMLRSTDGGANWSPFQNGFGADGSSWDRKVFALLALPGAPGTVLAASRLRIGKSTDGGLTWKKVSVAPGGYFFLTSGISTLWAGGESNAFTPFVKRSTNGGESWTNSFGSGSDNVARAMAFDPSDPNVAFLGLSGDLRRTANNGVSWAPVPLPAGVGSSALGARAFPPLRLYAHGITAPGDATFFKTDDGGASWTPVSFADAGSSQVWTLLVRSGPAADTLFLGTGSGVLRYVELQVVGVEPPLRESRLELRAHPNPFRAGTTLTFDLPRASKVLLRVLDTGGREVATLPTGEWAAGRHRLFWAARGLPSGAYFCELRAGGERATRKVFVVR